MTRAPCGKATAPGDLTGISRLRVVTALTVSADTADQTASRILVSDMSVESYKPESYCDVLCSTALDETRFIEAGDLISNEADSRMELALESVTGVASGARIIVTQRAALLVDFTFASFDVVKWRHYA